MLNYTSEDFAEDRPTISRKVAERICTEHGATLEEYLSENGYAKIAPDLAPECYRVNTRALLDWLGY